MARPVRPLGTTTPRISSSSPSSSTCTCCSSQARRQDQVEVHIVSLARALLFRSTRRQPRCLCPMLDARDDLTSTTRVPYGGDEFEANHWADVEPIVTRAPRSSLEHGSSPISSAAGSGRNSPSGSGLRSRRAALQGQSGLGYGHRRSSTADDGVLAAAAVHPLQPSSPSRMGLSRSAEEGVTRPALKRLLSDKGLWPESAADAQEGVQDDGIRKRGDGEMLVIVHEVFTLLS